MSTDYAVTTLPSSEELAERLRFIIREETLKNGFYPHLYALGGKQLNGQGIVMALELAIHDYIQATGVPPVIGAVIRQYFPRLIRALTYDDQVQTDALQFLKEVKEKMQQDAEATPIPPRPELTDEDKTVLVTAIKRIPVLYDRCVTGSPVLSRQHRAGGVNPFYHQTANGLYLEFYYSLPSKLWTPWGEWTFAASQPHETDLDGFMGCLETRIHVPGHQTQQGHVGPVYAIMAVESTRLPAPELLTDRRQYLEYNDARSEWDSLFVPYD